MGCVKVELQFQTVPASKCPKRDVLAAIDIYCKSVDQGSLTDTNQIKDYIWNAKSHSDEKRTMFFYLLYDSDRKVEGFAEFAYLPKNQVLVLDYLCTQHRNHVLFYNFYHMVLQDIEDALHKKEQFIRYAITELSLNQLEGKLVDTDSNYFRHLLSNENYTLLKYPYYQPPLLEFDEVHEFNLAIKLFSSDKNGLLILDKTHYLSIVRELYIQHYAAWFNMRSDFLQIVDELLVRIEHEIIQNSESMPIALVQCALFEDGQCPKFSPENITIPRMKRKKQKWGLAVSVWILLTFLTCIFCIIPRFSQVEAIVCSVLTIIAGAISIISFRRDFFR